MYRFVEKRNGEVIRTDRKNFISTKPYLYKKEACFNEFINQNEIDNISLADINKVKLNITYIFSLIINTKNSLKIYEILYNKLKNINTQKDFEDLIKYIEVSYGVILTNSHKNRDVIISKNDDFNTYYTNHKDLVCSIITKKIVVSYFEQLLNSLLSREINHLYNMIVSKQNFNDILKYLNIEFNDVSKNNGIELLSKKVLYDLICKTYDNQKKHLCGDCVYANNCTCPKVKNRVKKDIEDYAFILNGFQVYDKNEIDRFVVSDCWNYKKLKPKKLCSEDFKQIHRFKESIKLHYYDAETIEEASQIEQRYSSKCLRKNITTK